jgi:multidrug efflux pump subunit AcrA (membrane-fusion protein)
VSLILAEKKGVVLVPMAAVTDSRDGGKQVFIPNQEKKKKPTPRAVEVGLQGADKVEIVSGVTDGEPIVIVGKRYSPQRGSASSPLIMGGSPRQGSGRR